MKYLTLFLATALAAVLLSGCGNGSQFESPGMSITSFTFNGEPVPLTSTDYRYENDTVYLATTVLNQRMHLELQELVPGRQIGICTDELCIPYALDPSEENAAIKDGEQFFIPIIHLMESLGSTAVWNKESGTLEVDYRLHDSDSFTASLNNGLKSAPVSFSLPDLDGKVISLDDFRGKKVAVFCWASW